ncbi:hypothetical protein T440DRAFT_485539 [Plenodomus tracheiphilus IPT5]|uniref:Uncharacterized protein n=1 Tax=Plenodomus tracheiphilus IPT5 TaxID=1408161 RepID=A0A6A7BM92_9PLEO|nr:hypothetical protein T440DRAFT_485539 [Plenodomus tracheiphilus IPT5]
MLLLTIFSAGLGLLTLFVPRISGSPIELGTPYCGMIQDTEGVGYGLYATSEGARPAGTPSHLGQYQEYNTKLGYSCYFFNDDNCKRSYFTHFSGGASVTDTNPKHRPQAYKCCLSIGGVQGSCTHCGTAVFCTPVRPTLNVRGDPGLVTDAAGKQYALYDTGDSNIRVITDKINGEFMKPVSYIINSNHICKFWSEATRGVGYLIGEFKGPVEAEFGSHWAAYFECWDVTKAVNVAKPITEAHSLAGNVLDVNNVAIMLQVKEEVTVIGKKEYYYDPKSVNVAEGHTCELYIAQATRALHVTQSVSNARDNAGQIVGRTP